MASLYFLSLLMQTLLALVALGLAGGGLLHRLRRPRRRWLWLASPLAGLMGLGAFVTLTHHTLGLPVPWAALAVWMPLTLFTISTLYQSRPRFRLRLQWLALLAAPVVAAWATWGCNVASLRMGEPAIVATDGSDQYGYAAYADWLLANPGPQPPFDPNQPHLAYASWLWDWDTRYSAFILLGLAAWLRDTSAIFSYDWLTGVALAAGVLGFAGLFATRRLGLVLLLTAGMLSAWFAIARTGYLGRLLAYPGAMLLAYALWALWEEFSWARVAIVSVIGSGIALTLNPGVTQVVAGLIVLGGLAAGLVCRSPLANPSPESPASVWGILLVMILSVGAVAGSLSNQPAISLLALAGGVALAGWCLLRQPGSALGLSWRCVGVGMLGYLAACLPLVLHHRLTRLPEDSYACTVVPWRWALPLALDLESGATPLLRPERVRWLVAACVASWALLLVAAWVRRQAESLALLAFAGLVLAACYFGRNLSYVFPGMLFPLGVAGAALLWQQARRSPLVLRGALLVLLAGFVALRVPQHRAQWDRYVHYEKRHFEPYTRSEMDNLARVIGEGRVDVVTVEHTSSFVMLVELGRRGCRLQLRRPTWERLLAWCKDWPMGDPPRGDFTLTDAPATLRGQPIVAQSKHFTLTADRNGVSVVGYDMPHGMERDDQGPVFWVGGDRPVLIDVDNGASRPRLVLLSASCIPGPVVKDQKHRTALVTLGTVTQRVELTAPDRLGLRLPIWVPPGRHTLALTVAERPDTRLPGPDQRDMVLLVRQFQMTVLPAHTQTPTRGSEERAEP